MTMPWIRLEAGIAQNPKMLDLVGRKAHRAALGYVFGLAYCGAQETDGYIPRAALPFLHLTPKDAAALVAVGLWDATEGGWLVPDWLDYQPSRLTIDAKREAGRRGACSRWHREGCTCTSGGPTLHLVPHSRNGTTNG